MVCPLVVKPAVLGAAKTVSLLAGNDATPGMDLLQTQDPWNKGRPQPMTVAMTDPVQDLEDKVLDKVLSRLPQERMEVDGDQVESRLQTLEQQVAALHQSQQGIQTSMSAQAEDQRQQLQQLSHTFQVRHDALEQTVANNQQQFQDQLTQQLAQQQQMLDGMFSKQMEQFESLLGKRTRRE